MSRFIKLIQSDDADFLQENYPNAFLLLIQIAKTARRTAGGLDGLEIGDAIVGEIETSRKAGLSRKEYRNALEKLIELGYIEVVFNPISLEPQKRAIKRATKSKIVNLLKLDVCDINPEDKGEHKGDLRATLGRPEGDKQERTRKNKKEKETTTPPNPQRGDRVVVFYDCLKENKDLNEDEKESLQSFPENRVKLALEFSKIDKPKTTLIQLLIWHCKQAVPPRPTGRRFTDQQRMAIDFNAYLLSIGQELLYHENLKNIEDGAYMLIPLNGCPTPITLNTSVQLLKKDFEEVKSQQRKLKYG